MTFSRISSSRRCSTRVTQLLSFLFLFLCSLNLSAAGQQIAFTWDDLPSHSSLPKGETRVGIAKAILQAMHENHLPPAYGFLNGIRTQQEVGSEQVLADWRAAGLPLGNHTWSHLNLNTHTAAQFDAEVQQNEPLLQRYMGQNDWRWFRFPFLAEGDTPEKRQEVRAFLAQHGYRIAGVTLSFADYAWNEPYARCLARHNQPAIRDLEASYLRAADSSLTYTHTLSQALFGRDLPYVLLMHVGAFDARMLPRLLALYRQRGVTFITLEQAEADPFYRADVDLTQPYQDLSLEARMAARRQALPPHAAIPDVSSVCR